MKRELGPPTFLHSNQTTWTRTRRYGAHPLSYSVGTGGSFPT